MTMGSHWSVLVALLQKRWSTQGASAALPRAVSTISHFVSDRSVSPPRPPPTGAFFSRSENAPETSTSTSWNLCPLPETGVKAQARQVLQTLTPPCCWLQPSGTCRLKRQLGQMPWQDATASGKVPRDGQSSFPTGHHKGLERLPLGRVLGNLAQAGLT